MGANPALAILLATPPVDDKNADLGLAPRRDASRGSEFGRNRVPSAKNDVEKPTLGVALRLVFQWRV